MAMSVPVNPMNISPRLRSSHRRRGPFAIALALIACGAVAQTTTTPTTARNSASETDDAIKLTPFTVSTDKDTGFAATSALAGGRLATDLRDTPAAYSVINRDFIDALNLTDLQQAQNWATGSTFQSDIGTF